MKKLLLTLLGALFVYAVPAIATTVNVGEPKTSCTPYAILWLVSVSLMSFGVWSIMREKRSDAGFAFATAFAVVFAIGAGTVAGTAGAFATAGAFVIGFATLATDVTLAKKKAFYFGVTAYYMVMAASMTAFLT